MTAWLFPAQQNDTALPSNAQIAAALDALVGAADEEELRQALEAQSAVLLSGRALIVLYMTTIGAGVEDDEEAAQALQTYLHLLHYARINGVNQAYQRLVSAQDDTDLAELFPSAPADWLAPLTEAQAAFPRDEHPLILAVICQELGDLQAQVFDQTQNGVLLEQISANYSAALSLIAREENAQLWAYLHMRRSIVSLHRQGGERASHIEQAIADLEAALDATSREDEPQMWVTINTQLGIAYTERVHDHHTRNLQRAVEAYHAALEGLTLEDAPDKYLDIQQRLASAAVDLRDEQLISVSFDALREAARYFERAAMQQLEHAPPAPQEKSPDPALVSRVLEEWLAVTDREELYTLLVERLDVLVTQDALAALRRIHAEIVTTDQDGRAEHIAMLITLLENALAFSVEVAWQRYRIEILPALEAAVRLTAAASFQDVERRIAEQQGIFTSPAMLATLFLISCTSTSEMEAQQARQTIALLKYVRSHPLPPPEQAAVQDTHSENEDEPAFSLSPADFANVNLNDPFLALIMQDIQRLPPSKSLSLLPYLTQIVGAFHASRIGNMRTPTQQALEQIDRQETPYLWAAFHWGSAASTLFDPQGNIQEALEHCEAALTVLTETAAPSTWAFLMLTRGALHMLIVLNDSPARLSENERRAHIQQAICDLNDSEAFYAQQDTSLEWALVRVTRGMALIEQEKFTGANYNAEQVIADFDAAQPVLARQGSDWQCIWLYSFRARALYRSQSGDRAATLERVIEDCTSSIALCQSRASRMMADFWAHALLIRGIACLERIAGSPRDNVEQAINDFEQALTVFSRSSTPQDWAITLTNRGNAWMQRVEGEKSQNLERALQDFNDAVAVFQSGEHSQTEGQARMNRAMCYMQRVAGERVQNQRLALADCNKALALLEQAGMRVEQGMALANRAAIYMQMLAGDRRHNLELALADCNAALDIFSRAETPHWWAKTLLNRGMTLRGLALTTGLTQRGIGLKTFSQRLLSQHPESLTTLLGKSSTLFEQALVDISAALTIFSLESTPREWAAAMRERALTYAMQTKGYFTGKRVENMRNGIRDYDAALTVFSRQETPYDWAITIGNRGVLYNELASKENLNDAEHALADIASAMTVFTRQAAPSTYCRLQHIRAQVFVTLEQWPQAHAALLAVRSVQRDLSANASSPEDQTDIIAEFALIDIYAQDAWVMLHLQPVEEAAIAVALEEGRVQSQRAALELDDIRLERISGSAARDRMKTFLTARNRWNRARLQSGQHQPTAAEQVTIDTAYEAFIQARDRVRQLDDPDFMTPVPTLQDIARAIRASDEALVYLVAGSSLTETGGMAAIITRDREGEPRARLMLLPRLAEMSLFDLLDVEYDQTPLVRAKEAVTMLGRAGLDDVAALLLREGIRIVRLVPYSWLGLFPLPAVLISIGNGKQRPLSDLFEEVTVVPGARSLEIARERASSRTPQRHSLLIAGNPMPHQAQAGLPYAEAEAATIRRIAREHSYPETHIRYLRPGEITRERVIEELAQVRYAHLALHGQYHAGEPRRSRLVLAGTEAIAEQERSIYLGEVLDGAINLSGARLLVLSACETSIIDMQRVPNEALGIAAGFLQSGAAAVIASLWPVDDRATFLLMTRFAQLYLDPQALWPPARALAAAQRWLREEATNRVLAGYDPLHEVSSTVRSLRLSYTGARLAIQREAAARDDPDALPYADPFFWAGFVVMGV